MKKRISVLLLCCIVFISGCNMPGQDDQKIKKLDPEKLDSETTDINDRADYYEKYVTEPGDDMDEEGTSHDYKGSRREGCQLCPALWTWKT